MAGTLNIEVGPRVVLEGRDVTAEIRTPEVSEAASDAAADPDVRKALLGQQRRLLSTGDWVAEGRDIATVVAPDAELKVFLTASPEERARRRAEQYGLPLERVVAEQRGRDARDTGHGRSVDGPAPGAVLLDTTGLTIDEVVERIAEMARR